MVMRRSSSGEFPEYFSDNYSNAKSRKLQASVITRKIAKNQKWKNILE